MSRIHKVDSRLQHGASGVGMVVFGSPFIAIGTYFALCGFGVLPLPGRAHAPLWVIGLVGVAFALAGLAVSGAGMRGVVRRLRARRLAARHPDEPWWGDHPWDPRGQKDSPWGRVASAAGAFVFLLVFLSPFNWWAFLSGDGDAFLATVVGFFDLVALAAGAAFVYRLIGAVRHGSTQLAYRAFPFHPGGRVEAALSPNRFESQRVTLRYVEERYVTRGSGEDRATSNESRELWRETRELSVPGAAELPIVFALPDDEERVTRMTANPDVRYYELLVEAALPGVDFRTTFALPVYPRADSPWAAPSEASPTVAPFAPLAPPRPARLLALALAVVLGLGAIGYSLGESPALRWARAWMTIDVLPDLASTSGMDVALGRDGSVWVLTKGDLVRHPDGDAEAAEHLVGGEGAVRAPSAFAALLVEHVDGVWIGGWHGEVWRFSGGELGLVSGRDDGPRGRVYALAAFAGDVYAGADRLWRLDGSGTVPEPVEGLPAGSVRALLTDGDSVLYASVGVSVWRFDGESWAQVWDAPEEDREVRALARGARGEILAGTRSGLHALDPASGRARRLLSGVDVRDVARGRSGIWVGAWQQGVYAGDEDGEVWRGLDDAEGLPDGDVAGIVVDGAGAVWMALYGAGAARADRQALGAILGAR